MSTTIRALKHFIRNDAPLPASYHTSGPLPPRSAFGAFPDVLEAYDTFVRVRDTMQSNQRQAAEKRAAARQAQIDYRAAVAEAIGAGTDTTKVTNHEPRLLAEAEAHADLATKAKVMINGAGLELGRLVQQHGAECFADIEVEMAEAEEEINGLVHALEEAGKRWGDAWSLRLHLSHVVNKGGTSNGYQPLGVPRHVAAAARGLRSTLGDLDELKREESALADWRQGQVNAKAKNLRSIEGLRPTEDVTRRGTA